MGVVASQSIKGTAVTYVGAFIGFLSTLFIQTAYLKAEEIGLLQVMLQAATLLSSFALLGLNSSAYRFYPFFRDDEESGRGRDKGFLFYMLMVAVVGLAIIIPSYYLLRDPLTALFVKNSPDFVLHFDTVVPLTVCILFWLVFELYAVQLMRIAVPKLIREVLLRLILVGVYVLYATHTISFTTLIALYVSAYGLCALLVAIYIGRLRSFSLRHNFKDLTKDLKKDFFRYTFIYMLGSIGSTIASQLDIFMVSSISPHGTAAAGIFSIAFFMVAVIEIPSRSLLNIASPMMASAMKNNDMVKANSLYKRVALHQLLVGGFIYVLVLINLDNVYQIIPNGEIYRAGYLVFVFLGISKILDITFNFGNSLLSFSRYYQWNLYFTFIITGLAIVFNLLLIPAFDITGAAIATLLTRLLTYTIQQTVISRKTHTNPFSRELLIILLIFIAMAAIGFLIPKIANPYLDILVRTLPLASISIFVIYRLKISPDANAIAEQILFKRK